MTVVLVKATLAFGVALALALIARRASASTRHAILVAGQLAALTTPLLGFVVRPIEVEVEPWSAGASATAFKAAAHAAALQGAPAARVDAAPIVWVVGAVLVAAMRARSILRAHGIARRARPWNGVFLSDEIDQPVTIGARILLPREAQGWSAAELDAVLIHEQAHVSRRDSLLGLAGDAACAVYWFHPLAWLVARRARLEREQACDESVLSAGVPASAYAATLLHMARSAAAPAYALPMAHRSHLEIRIGAIVAGMAPHPRRAARTIVAAALVAVAPVLAALTPLVIARPSAGEPDLRGDSPPSSEWIGAAPVEVEATGPDAALIATLQQAAARKPRAEDDYVPDRSRWALAHVRNGELVAPLIAALGDRDWRVRAYAAWALGISRDRRATAALLPFLDDPVWRMRAMAAFALAKIADPAARAPMLRALSDPAWQVRVEAVHYLGDRRLLKAMLNDRHIAVRTAAKEALR